MAQGELKWEGLLRRSGVGLSALGPVTLFEKSRTLTVSERFVSAIPPLIPSQPQCCTKIVVLEGACHTCDLCAAATDFLSNRLPRPGHVGHFPDRGPGLF
jgi:hypothetical protein